MKIAIILLTSFGLLVVPVLAADALLPLKVGARLDTPYCEIVTSHESKILAVVNSSIDTTFDAFAPAGISTPTHTVVPTPTDTTEPKPTSSPTLVPESTDVPSSTSEPISTSALATTSVPSSMSTQAVIPLTRSTATAVLKPTNATIRESATAAIEMPLATLTQATWTATVTRATWTATVVRVATSIATHTGRVGSEPPSPLLDRLIRNKPSIWGNKGFYILLGVLYLTLLCLFLKRIISPFKRQP